MAAHENYAETWPGGTDHDPPRCPAPACCRPHRQIVGDGLALKHFLGFSWGIMRRINEINPHQQINRMEKARKLASVLRSARATSYQVGLLDAEAWGIAAQLAEVRPPGEETKLLVAEYLREAEALGAEHIRRAAV